MKRAWWAVLGLCCTGLSQAAITLIDDAGRPLTLAAPAQRIVSLAPHITDMLLQLQARPQIVGVADDHELPAAYQRSRTGLPVVADAHNLNEERLAALKPDLVLIWRSGTPAARAERIEARYPVFYIEPRTLDGIATNLEALGQLTGREAEATVAAQGVRRELTQLRQAYRPGKRLRAFYEVWLQPLYTVQGQHLISQGLSLCGADNIMPAGQLAAPLVNLEFVLAARPEVIFFGARQQETSRRFWSRFSSLPAVQRQQLLSVDADTLGRPGPALIKALRPLCASLAAWRR